MMMGSGSSWIRRLPGLLTLLQILMCGVHGSQAKDLCKVGDRDALLAFKKQLIDEGGTYADWNVTKDCCAGWSGVFCNTKGTVDELFITGNCRTCVGGNKIIADPKATDFGAPLAKLKDLTALYFDDVQIRFRLPIPPQFFTFPKLRVLSLQDCEFKGVIPTEVGYLVTLQELFLAGNKFSGGIPDSIANLKNLQILALGRNHMTTIGSHKITLLKKLDKLDLSYNKLKGPIPKWLTGITITGAQYGELDLDHNQFSGPIPGELCNIKPGLRTIQLTGNKLSGPIPAAIGECVQLQDFYVSENTLSGPLPHAFGKLKNLMSLIADHNQITGPLPVELGDLPNFIQINLNDNKLTGHIPSNYGPYSTDFPLAGIFTNNKLTGPIPLAMQQLGVKAFRPGNPGLCGPPLHNKCK